jgi:hypothetical protein
VISARGMNLLLTPVAVVLCQVACRAIIENCVFSIGIKILAVVLALMGKYRSSSRISCDQHHFSCE